MSALSECSKALDSRPRKNSKIVIVVAGTFGLSTAWHLARSGYTNVKPIDKSSILSPDGYRGPQLVRTESMQPMYSQMSRESFHAWQKLEPLASSGVFHNCGWIMAVRNNTDASKKAAVERANLLTQAHGNSVGLERLPNSEAIRVKHPQLAAGRRAAWFGFHNLNGGWVEAERAIEIIARDAKKLEVKFISGPSGFAKRFCSAYGLDTAVVVGVETEDEAIHEANKVVLALGNYSENLLDFEGQLIPTTSVRCSLQLSTEQVEEYKSLPVIDILEQGCLFPPDYATVLRVCSDAFTTHITSVADFDWLEHDAGSRSDSEMESADDRYNEQEKAVSDILEEWLPTLLNNKLVSSELCYVNECFDENYIIFPPPSSPLSLFVATAGSGHAFKEDTSCSVSKGPCQLNTVQPGVGDPILFLWMNEENGDHVHCSALKVKLVFLRPGDTVLGEVFSCLRSTKIINANVSTAHPRPML